ncbi:MAG TPA: HIT family protein [Caulobacteraceae bacterium]|nr:HIT family protein [Caulobacteraceae bacterium]
MARKPGPCPFCALASGETPTEVVYEDAATLAFLDHAPLAIGHCLLIPRAHVATLFEADAATVTALALAARTVAVALKAAFAADGVFVAQNNVVSQSVPHLHVHIVPRFFGDKLFSGGSMVWRRVRYASDAHRAETAQRIRAAL